jgi:REP element-mobilizing transposase RayT
LTIHELLTAAVNFSHDLAHSCTQCPPSQFPSSAAGAPTGGFERLKRVGHGSVYQGRYKSFPLRDDAHFTTVARYVERNPLRANLVRRAQTWRWSSLRQKLTEKTPLIPLTPWPICRRKDWIE